MLSSIASTEVLDTFQALFLDLDGVVYRSGLAVDHAVDSLNVAHQRGLDLRFLTNNASRTPEAVAENLIALGISARPEMVITSAMAVADQIRSEHSPGSHIFVVGHEGLERAIADVGLVPTRNANARVSAVVQGFSPDTSWRDLAAAGQLIRQGTPWFASNTDTTVPTAAGLAPGNGAFVQLLSEFTGRVPKVAGKPHSPLFDTARDTVEGRILMIGDRLDTDIEGARTEGIDSAWVATGVHGIEDVMNADPEQRPNFLLADLSGLSRTQSDVLVSDKEARCGSAKVLHADSCIALTQRGENAEEEMRALVGLAWHVRDVVGVPSRLNATLEP